MDRKEKGKITAEMAAVGFSSREILGIMYSVDELERAVQDPRYQFLAAAIKFTVGCSVDLGEAVPGKLVSDHHFPMPTSELQEMIDYLESRVFTKRRSLLEEVFFFPAKRYQIKWDEEARNFRYIQPIRGNKKC